MLLQASVLKQKAKQLQIDGIGITPVKQIPEQVAQRFRRYLEQGQQAEMHYLEKHFDKRLDPAQLLPEAKSIVVILCAYRQDGNIPVNPHISLYAQGVDYHAYVKEKLFALANQMPEKTYRCFCDTAPVLEKYWAEEAGLGVIGKNSLLISPVFGSYCFIGILLSQAGFDVYDRPLRETPGFTHPCESCNRCVQACPNHALEHGLDARQCLSYLTIEHKGERPPLPGSLWFGCDICQNACPANRNVAMPGHAAFRTPQALLDLNEENVRNMQPNEFERLFAHSAIRRAGLEGLQKNIFALQKTSKDRG